MERRTVLSLLTGAAGALAAAIVAIPLVGPLLNPLRRAVRSSPNPWLALGALESFPIGQPTRVSVPVTITDGWTTTTEERAAWVLRQEPSGAVVFTGACPHLGCSVKWRGAASQFECPCHDSGFAADGARKAGPARRGLDALPSRVEGGRLEIQWEDYAANVAEKRALGGSP
jgi:menaquinol-cytochrome c reductase iron-sulfur subunit